MDEIGRDLLRQRFEAEAAEAKKVTVVQGELITTMPLVALETVAEGGLLQQAKDAVLLWFE